MKSLLVFAALVACGGSDVSTEAQALLQPNHGQNQLQLAVGADGSVLDVSVLEISDRAAGDAKVHSDSVVSSRGSSRDKRIWSRRRRRASRSGEVMKGPSKPEEQTTSNECVDILAIGDYGSLGKDQAEVAVGLAKVAEEMNPVSIHGIGDNIYEEGVEKNPTDLVKQWRDVYHKHEALQRRWFAILGNHDWRAEHSPKYQKEFTVHDDNTGGFWRMPAFWYKVTTKSQSGLTVDKFHIDTEIWTGDAEDVEDSVIKDQKDWLEAALSGSDADWKIVIGHHPIYSAGFHGANPKLFDLDAMFRKHGVNMYLAGHDHTQHLVVHEGVYYIVSGAGSKNAFRPKGKYFKKLLDWVRSQAAGRHKGKGLWWKIRHNPKGIKWLGKFTKYFRKGFPTGSLKKAPIDDWGFVSLRFCDAKTTLKLWNKNGDEAHHTEEIAKPAPFIRHLRLEQQLLEQQVPVGFGLETSQVEENCNGVNLKADIQCTACRVNPDVDPSTSSCKKYCRSQGLKCVGAWENEEDETCEPGRRIKCNAHSKLEGLMCECA